MASANRTRSLPELLSEILSQFAILTRKEAQLARAEMSEKARFFVTGLGLVVAGAVLVTPALVILLQSAVAALQSTGLARVWALLVVGGCALAVGLILLVVGIVWLKAARPVPERAIEQLRRDASLAKRQLGIESDTTDRAA